MIRDSGFTKHFNREFIIQDFPYFVPLEEMEYNIEYAQRIIDNGSIARHWRERVELGGWREMEQAGEAIAAHGGLILEICAGPAGGFSTAVLMKDYNAKIMLNDLCPTVLREWQNFFKQTDNPPPNVEFAAFDVDDMPFADNSLDVICGADAVINLETDCHAALTEIYRVLKPGGLFVFDYMFVTEEYFKTLPEKARNTLKQEYPMMFWDYLQILDDMGFVIVEQIDEEIWSNENYNDGTLHETCRELGVSLTFVCFLRICKKAA